MAARIVLASIVILAGAGRAGAQSTEFTLTDDGWLETRAPEPGTDEHVMAEARRLLAERRPGRARSVLTDWIDEHKRSDNPWLPEAYLLRADARLAQDEEYAALFDLERIATDYPGSEQFAEALQREFDIAVRYVNGLRRRFLGVRLENARPTGEELLIRIQERLPGSRLAERAAITLADHYYKRRDLKLAAEMYGIFVVNFPDSDLLDHAKRRQIAANVVRFKGPKYDGSGLLEARLLSEAYRAENPAEAERAGVTAGLLNWIDESEALQRLEIARWYLQTGDEPSARLTLRRLLRAHPESSAAQEAMRLMTARGWVETVVQSPEAGSEADG